jgi:hypothetical protein
MCGSKETFFETIIYFHRQQATENHIMGGLFIIFDPLS